MVPREAPPQALEKLEAIAQDDMDIQECKAQLDALYRRRDTHYIEAQQAGATIRELAVMAGVSENGVKYMLSRAKAKL